MIYLDHAATTQTDKEVLKAMKPYYDKYFGNPSSLYALGCEAKKAIEDARQRVSDILHCEPEEIIFTAGGTESDNLAIFGVMEKFLTNSEKYHCITSNIEHPAVLYSYKKLEKFGFNITYIKVDQYGLINPKDILRALRPNTVLVSIMYANNEIGTIQKIIEIGRIIKNYRHIQRIDTLAKNSNYPVFHSDACQAAGYLDINTDDLGVDLMTLNGSKIYGPKQIGALFKKKNIQLAPLLCGGSQENGFRPGTENTASIVGFAKALELAEKNKAKESIRLKKLRDYFIMELLKIDNTILNGHPEKRLPNNVNVTFRYIEGESIMLKLDKEGIYVSTGSACHSQSLDPSHVILALGQNSEDAHGSMRFTMGKDTTKKNLDKTIRIVKKAVKELRAISAIDKE